MGGRMKKLKLRGKELKRIGYTTDQAISLALNLVHKYFRRSGKEEILELLEKINLHRISILMNQFSANWPNYWSKSRNR
jgi:hypothetical protein